ncbi:MAG TPA: hypothetical protein VLZ75_05305 [Chitinophagales bacterium]|nr:hypothetical protein [Chitinophagales bacterium]
MYVPFEEMPDHAKVWLYPSVDYFEDGIKSDIENEIKTFVTEWLSHQREVKGSSKIFADGIICLAADQTDFEVSGCSIDSSYRFIRDLEEKYKLLLFERDLIFFKNAYGGVILIKICDIDMSINNGVLTEDTPIFNLQAQNVGQLKDPWIPIKDTPYSRFMPAKKDQTV